MRARTNTYDLFFHFSSFVTDVSPQLGARVLDGLLMPVAGSSLLSKWMLKRMQKQLSAAKKIKKILVVGDLNIGDAVTVQSGITALHELFPRVQIDYVIKESARNIIEGNPFVSNLFPVYQGVPTPSEQDIAKLLSIVQDGAYDLIMDFSPMIDSGLFEDYAQAVVDFSPMAAEMMRNEKDPNGISNVIYQGYVYILNLFAQDVPNHESHSSDGVGVYLSDEAIERAVNFISDAGIALGDKIILINPDASTQFTRMPFEVQSELLKSLTDLDCKILLGAGQVERLIEEKLLSSIPRLNRRKVTVVPREIPLDTYAAFVDASDVFISGDTGPLHIAAARKYSRTGRYEMRNHTAVVSIFGSTPSRIYGYDSGRTNFFAANQDALSRVYIAPSPCRNITCINKAAKTCSRVRCFDNLNIRGIVSDIKTYLDTIENFTQIESKKVYAK
ncbi:MAG: hypothetical protein M1470_06470 [Bacteroidetes bacterium]|nr:hypothetical protein [Bacteroidota bacterium]MCL5739153.1 hypothetical protein [Bacteroidota bacterium]